jgi:hypothetical protein
MGAAHMRLGSFQDMPKTGGIGHIAIVQKQPDSGFVGVGINAAEAAGIEGGSTADKTVNLIAFGE